MIDAWIALALRAVGSVDLRETPDLRGLVAAADWLNRAIPTHEELARGLASLSSRGLLAIDGSRVALAPLASEKLGGRRTIQKAWDHAKAWIASVPATLEPHAPPIDPATLRAAIDLYVGGASG